MSAWEQWEQELASAAPSTEQLPASAGGQPAGGSRRGRRRTARRQRRIVARSAQRAVRRRYLADMESIPGVAVLVLAVVVAGVVVGLRLSADSNSAATAGTTTTAPSADATAADGAAATLSIELDPHAGVEVLPPRGMPAAPGPPDTASTGDPVAAGIAFAAQACAYLPGETPQQYQERLAPLSSPQLAASWQHGSAQRVHCLQLTATLASTDPAAPVVDIAAVQVYHDPTGVDCMRAYRWSATVSLKPGDSGWRVTG